LDKIKDLKTKYSPSFLNVYNL